MCCEIERFDPRSRVGSDRAIGLCTVTQRVSIHAPARGATEVHPRRLMRKCFDPRSRAGSDLLAGDSSVPKSFDPRSRAGSDFAMHHPGFGGDKFRSTLPRGERPPYWTRLDMDWSFDPRSRAGSDRGVNRTNVTVGFDPRSRAGSDSSSIAALPWPQMFRSTLPRGERLAHTGSSVLAEFRSTLPRGERPAPLRSSSTNLLFRSTLPRGERQRSVTMIHCGNVFRSTLPRGERPSPLAAGAIGVLFLSTLPRGERRNPIIGYIRKRVFRSTLPRGERQAATKDANGISFDPRSRAGSDPVSRQQSAHRYVSIHAPARGATLRP